MCGCVSCSDVIRSLQDKHTNTYTHTNKHTRIVKLYRKMSVLSVLSVICLISDLVASSEVKSYTFDYMIQVRSNKVYFSFFSVFFLTSPAYSRIGEKNLVSSSTFCPNLRHCVWVAELNIAFWLTIFWAGK